MTRGALAVSSGDMYGSKLILGVAKVLAKFPGVGEIFFYSSCADPAKHRKAGKEVFDCLLVVHIFSDAKAKTAMPWYQTMALLTSYKEKINCAVGN